jgi:hypothetical protein
VLACTGADPVYDATVIVEGTVIKDVQAGVRSIEHANFLDEPTAKLMAAKGTFLVPTFVTYEKLHEQGRERGLTAAQLAKLDLVLGNGLDGLRRARRVRQTAGRRGGKPRWLVRRQLP